MEVVQRGGKTRNLKQIRFELVTCVVSLEVQVESTKRCRQDPLAFAGLLHQLDFIVFFLILGTFGSVAFHISVGFSLHCLRHEHFRRAVEAHPSNSNALFQLGLCALELGPLEDAVELMNKSCLAL